MAGGRRAREMGHALNRTCGADDPAAFRAFADGLYGKVTGPLSWRADGGRSCYAWTGISYDLGRVVWLDISNQSLNDIIASRCRRSTSPRKCCAGRRRGGQLLVHLLRFHGSLVGFKISLFCRLLKMVILLMVHGQGEPDLLVVSEDGEDRDWLLCLCFLFHLRLQCLRVCLVLRLVVVIAVLFCWSQFSLSSI